MVNYKKLDKPRARVCYNSGNTIYLLPCKCSAMCLEVESIVQALPINKLDPTTNESDLDFDKRVMYFEYYNCTGELGHYAHYYIKEDNKEVRNEITEQT